jgi:DNA-binding Lrp family transcriptional regulator
MPVLKENIGDGRENLRTPPLTCNDMRNDQNLDCEFVCNIAHIGNELLDYDLESCNHCCMSNTLELDEIDRKILNILQDRADIPNNALADEVGLTPGPCLRRVQRLREQGVIRKFTVHLNNKLVGFQMSAFVEITLEHHTSEAADKFIEIIANKPQILSCHMVTGDCDFVLRVLAKDLDEYRRLIWEELHRIEGVKKIRSIVILDTLKDQLNPGF